MGQYQQWLHYREQEQQLRAQLEKLEAELAELQARSLLLEEPGAYEQNPLLHLLLLAARLDSAPPASPVQADQSLTNGETAFSSSPSSAQRAEGETPAFFPWNGPLDLNMPADREMTVPSTPFSHPEIELLPEDMISFFDEHTQTSPQLQLPWWMRGTVPTAASANTPTDLESIRNNRDIERWLERWGRQPSSSEQEGDRRHG